MNNFSALGSRASVPDTGTFQGHSKVPSRKDLHFKLLDESFCLTGVPEIRLDSSRHSGNVCAMVSRLLFPEKRSKRKPEQGRDLTAFLSRSLARKLQHGKDLLLKKERC